MPPPDGGDETLDVEPRLFLDLSRRKEVFLHSIAGKPPFARQDVAALGRDRVVQRTQETIIPEEVVGHAIIDVRGKELFVADQDVRIAPVYGVGDAPEVVDLQGVRPSGLDCLGNARPAV